MVLTYNDGNISKGLRENWVQECKQINCGSKKKWLIKDYKGGKCGIKFDQR